MRWRPAGFARGVLGRPVPFGLSRQGHSRRPGQVGSVGPDQRSDRRQDRLQRECLIRAGQQFIDRPGDDAPMLCFVGASTPSVATAPTCQSGQGDASGEALRALPNSWSAARMSMSGRCFWIKDDATTGTTFGSGTPCTGVAAAGASASAFPA